MKILKRLLNVSLLCIMLLALAFPSLATAQNPDYLQWTAGEKEYHLYDDVRTITFSQDVHEDSLKRANNTLPITLWDVTNLKDKKQLAIEVSLLDEHNDKITVRLAEGVQYEDGHQYTMYIEDDIYSTSTKTHLTNSIQYDFKMVYKHPEEIAFAENYKVTNTSDDTISVPFPIKAYYVITDQYGNYERYAANSTSSNQSLYLKPSETAHVSYLEKLTEVLPSVEGITIEKTSGAAYIGKKLYERNSVKANNVDKFGNTFSFVGSTSEAVTYSSTNYPKESNTTHSSSSYKRVVEKDLNSLLLLVGEHAVVTNEEHAPLYIFSPNTSWKLSTLEEIDEDAVTVLALLPGDKLNSTSTENTYLSTINLREATNKGKFSYVTYAEGQSDTQKLDKEVYTFGDDALTFNPKGEMILENAGNYPMTIYASSRFVTLKQTDEELFTLHTLKANDKVQLTSSEDVPYSGLNLRDLSKKGSFSYTQYANNKSGTPIFNNPIYSFGDDRISISQNGDTILKNTGTTDQFLYGAKRYISIQSVKEEPLNIMTLAPGQTIKATSTEGIQNTSIYLNDPSKRGTYSYMAMRESGENEYTGTLDLGKGNVSLNTAYYTTITNTGTVPFSVYGPMRFIEFE